MHLHSTVLIAYVLSIALIDMRTHRIPNVISAAALAAAFTVSLATGGAGALADALVGMLAGLLIFLPFYLVRAFGAGDVKAMAVVGAFLGFESTLAASATTLIVGAVIGLGVMLKNAPSARSVMARILGTAFALTSGQRMEVSAGRDIQRFPYGVAIAIGTLIVVTYTGNLPFNS
ncbi:MAG: A24 family peptidase [Steroidobacteraceae bacterium]